MSATKYNEEEIERKRLLALQRRKEAQCKTQNIFSKTNDAVKIIETSTSKHAAPNLKPCGFPKKLEGNSLSSLNSFKCKSRLSHSIGKDNRYNPIQPSSFFEKSTNISAKCYMIDNSRFAVEPSSFHKPVIETFKNVSSRQYDPQTRIWNFHLNDYDNLLQTMRKTLGITVTGIPDIILQIFRRHATLDNDVSKIDLGAIDEKLKSSLMPFQRDGICYGISKNGRCIIADDMGLGKTIQALGIAHYYKDEWPLLIVTPSSVRYQWSEAIRTFLPSVPLHHIHHFTNARDTLYNVKIVIVSYDLLVRAVDTFERHDFGVAILDESHTVKSQRTARYKAVESVTSRTRHIVLLSGTPALSRPIELHTQIYLVLRKFLGLHDYGVRYCAAVKKQYGWDYTGSSNLQELQLLLKASCMIRRLKNEVLCQLPSKIRQVIVLDPDLIQAGTKQMEKMTKELQKKSLKGVDRRAALLQYYSESSVAKIQAICNHISNLLEKHEKFLVFAHHQNVLDAISELLESRNVRFIRIDGKTSPEQRKLQVDKFQDHDHYMVAVLSITAANAGITLTAAQLVVFAELFWNPGILCQAEDRVHRLGQKGSVLIQYLVAKQTVDDYLWPLIESKMVILNSAGLEQNFCLSEADFMKQSPAEGGTQRKLSFYDVSKVPESQASTSTAGNAESIVSIDKNKEVDEQDLLDIDEEAFASCDWDNIE